LFQLSSDQGYNPGYFPSPNGCVPFCLVPPNILNVITVHLLRQSPEVAIQARATNIIHNPTTNKAMEVTHHRVRSLTSTWRFLLTTFQRAHLLAKVTVVTNPLPVCVAASSVIRHSKFLSAGPPPGHGYGSFAAPRMWLPRSCLLQSIESIFLLCSWCPAHAAKSSTTLWPALRRLATSRHAAFLPVLSVQRKAQGIMYWDQLVSTLFAVRSPICSSGFSFSFGQDGELRGCINDARNVRDFLCCQFGSTPIQDAHYANGIFLANYGYKPEDIVMLTDDTQDWRRMPTRQNLVR